MTIRWEPSEIVANHMSIIADQASGFTGDYHPGIDPYSRPTREIYLKDGSGGFYVPDLEDD